MQLNTNLRLIGFWRRLRPLRFLIPIMAWAAAASAGGLFVYGCSSNNANEINNWNVNVDVSGLNGGTLSAKNQADSSATFQLTNTDGQSIDVLGTNAKYNVVITSEPTDQYCYLTSGGSGTMEMANVTADITCGSAGTTYSIGGVINGISGGDSFVVLLDNGSNSLQVNGPSTGDSINFTFTAVGTQLPAGALYNVTVAPATATSPYCYVSSGGGGIIGISAVTDVVVTCGSAVQTPATVGGTVTGLTGTGTLILQNNGGDNLPLTTASVNPVPFTFATGLPASATYNVTVPTWGEPTGLYCYPSAGGGGTISLSGSKVTTVAITCVDASVTTYAVTVAVAGLTTVGLILQDNGGDNLAVPADPLNGIDTFPSELPNTVKYNVTILQQPTGQICSVTHPTGGPGTSATVTCNTGNPIPTLTSISPNTTVAASNAANFTLTATGTNFVSGASTIEWNGTALTTTFVNSNQLTAIVLGSDIATVNAAIPVTVVTTPAGGVGGGTSNAVNFSVTASNPAPTITSFSPPSAIAGSAFSLAINGTGFNSSTTVTFGGAALTATLQSPAQLTISVPADDATAGSIPVVVTNPTPGGGSATDNFTITAQNPAPTITSLSPPSAAAGSTSSLTLTVNGTGYFHTSATSQSTVQWNGTALVTTYVSDTQLTTVVPSSDLTNAGSAVVTVVNPTPGGGTSNAETFSITSASTAPTILATLQNVANTQNSTWASTINIWNIATPAAPTSLGQISGQSNVLSIAIDPSNNIYFLAVDSGLSTSFFACPAPAAGGTYTCVQRGTAGAIPQGGWLAVDGQGNAYATQFSDSLIGVVSFPTAAGPVTGTSSNITTVYTSAGGNTVSFYGLAVTPDGSTLYVSEGPVNEDNGFDLTMHMCSTQCTVAGGTDITQMLVTNGGIDFALSGAVAIGPGNAVYVGGANASDGTTSPNTLTVAEVCSPSGSGANLTFACKVGQQTYVTIDADINPFADTPGIAADSSGNTYAAVLIENNSITPTPPTFIGFKPPGSAANLTYFSISGPQGPAIGAPYYDAPPYAMAITAIKAQ